MALVRKILETTLTAGSTSVTFTDTDIPNSLLRVYCTKASLFPLSQTLSGNVLSVNYKAQSENVGIALEIVKQGLDIVDGLTSEDATKALSANQGYVLKGLIDGIVIPTVPENITDLDDVSVTSIQNGQVLAWNSTTEKFENVNQSGGSSVSFGTAVSESVVGLNVVNATHLFEHTGIACIYGRTSGSSQGYIYFTCAGMEYAMTTTGSWDTCLTIPVNAGDTLTITQLSARHSIVQIRVRPFV